MDNICFVGTYGDETCVGWKKYAATVYDFLSESTYIEPNAPLVLKPGIYAWGFCTVIRNGHDITPVNFAGHLLRAFDNRRLIDGPLLRCDSELMIWLYAVIRDILET